MKLSEGQQPPLTITEKNLVQYLGPRKYLPDDMAVQPQLGAVNGLAWTGLRRRRPGHRGRRHAGQGGSGTYRPVRRRNEGIGPGRP